MDFASKIHPGDVGPKHRQPFHLTLVTRMFVFLRLFPIWLSSLSNTKAQVGHTWILV